MGSRARGHRAAAAELRPRHLLRPVRVGAPQALRARPQFPALPHFPHCRARGAEIGSRRRQRPKNQLSLTRRPASTKELSMPAFNIGFVIFPNLTQLDFTGPLQVLHRLPGAKAHIIARTRDPVPSDCGLSLMPTATFANCEPLDLICIPGGFGVSGAIADAPTIDFVRRQAARAKYVTSVCTGAFVLGVAGLLRGRRATTHWAYTDLLPLVGAVHAQARVVRDGKI